MIDSLERVISKDSERLLEHRRRTIRLGELAIKAEALGINDPLTPLCDYIEKGDAATAGIKENFETTVAERLPETPFVNRVLFEFTGRDFVSVKDRFSMSAMVQRNLQILQEESSKRPDLKQEYERAKAEALEIEKITDWYDDAPDDSFIIFESLPIGKQKIAISRIYQKRRDGLLEGSFLSLYKPSVKLFNSFRREINSDAKECVDEIDILKSSYTHDDPEIVSSEDFVRYYVGVYDNLIGESYGGEHFFGLERESYISAGRRNGMEKVRAQVGLTNIYMDAIKALVDSRGRADDKIIDINERLNTGLMPIKGERMTLQFVRDFLGGIISSITSVIDRADDTLLNDLISAGHEANYNTVSYFGSQARSEGATYDSIGCPEIYSSNNVLDGASEQAYILKAFGIYGGLEGFGRAHIGVCRVANCPSHGRLKWFPERTLVGGCDVCVDCHKLFRKGQEPDKIYASQEDKKRRRNSKAA